LNRTPYVASLRVYEPLETFNFEVEKQWVGILPHSQTKLIESDSTIRNLISPERFAKSNIGAHVIDQDGKKFICPWLLKNRSYHAMQEFKESTSSSIFNFFVPNELEESLMLENYFENKVSYTISERWMIPPRWFALFEPQERQIAEQDNEKFCIYRTEIAKARKRCTETLKIVRNSFGIGSVEAEVSQLLDWLNLFDRASIVELDYGGLATFIDINLRSNGGKGLVDDTSVEDVIASISGLSEGDGFLASQAYGRLVTRWRQIANLEQAQ
jgi:hypothetical protein